MKTAPPLAMAHTEGCRHRARRRTVDATVFGFAPNKANPADVPVGTSLLAAA
jgi:hypothetical protein